jgi:hypothetical protein
MAQATHTILVSVNGKTLDARDVKIKVVHPESGIGSSLVTFTVPHSYGCNLGEIAGWQGVTLLCRCDSGLDYQISGACVTGLELSDGGGGVSIEFTGAPRFKL